jgi:outer membrane protein OmpA-like peptidoglycan-associated protein
MLMALLSVGTAHAAAPASPEQVRAELDRQLREMVDTTPPEVKLLFVGLDPSVYKLVEVHFTLDGQPVDVPSVEELARPGTHVLASRQVADGPHTLVSNIVYMDASWSLFSQTSGFLWNMTSTLNFQAQRGLRVNVKAASLVVPEAKDARLKVKLIHDVTAEMTAKLDDGTMPEPISKRPAPPDAGAVAHATPPPEPPKPSREPEPRPAPVTPQQQKVRLLVRALASRKPVEATLSVRGATAQKVALKRGAKAPAQVEVAPGDYTVDLIAPGFLAQTRRVQLSGSKPTPLDFTLVRAPKKKLVTEKGDRLELEKPPRFPEGVAVPKPATTTFLPQLVDLLVRGPIQRIRIEGHTDNKEAPQDSRQKLSAERARAVAELLVRAGVDPARVETVGLGDTRPKAPNFTPGGRELNRRVELVILER